MDVNTVNRNNNLKDGNNTFNYNKKFGSVKMRLLDLGERRIIDDIHRDFHVTQPKDDCAMIDSGDSVLLLSTDIIRESTHIPKGAKPEQIGNFVANINLSDIAAMAGIPIGMVLSYLVNPESDESFLIDVVRGVDKTLKSVGAEILGGDTKEGSELVISGTVLGQQEKRKVRKRSDLKPGHVIGVTNELGRCASGYIFYKNSYRTDLAINLILGIKARIKEAQIMSEYGAKFMTDLSDGLFSSMSQMKNDYGIGFRIVENELVPNRYVRKASDLSGLSGTEIMCAYGGDYEIMFSIENKDFKDFSDAMESEKINVHFIGDAWKGDNIINNDDQWLPIKEYGYEHFRPKPFE